MGGAFRGMCFKPAGSSLGLWLAKRTILDDRQGRGSTIVTSQIDVKHWHKMIANPTMADAIRSKQAGLPAPAEKAAARPAKVVILMDALRRSIEDSGGKEKTAKSSAKKADASVKPKRRAAKG